LVCFKVSQLQDNVHKKEVEMQAMEERYKKYIEKAKSVIKTLDPKQNPNAVPEVSALRKQLTEKDVLIETLEQVLNYNSTLLILKLFRKIDQG
jgi:hypothetical protein